MVLVLHTCMYDNLTTVQLTAATVTCYTPIFENLYESVHICATESMALEHGLEPNIVFGFPCAILVSRPRHHAVFFILYSSQCFK